MPTQTLRAAAAINVKKILAISLFLAATGFLLLGLAAHPATASEVTGTLQSGQGGTITNNDNNYQQYKNSLASSPQNMPANNDFPALLTVLLSIVVIGEVIILMKISTRKKRKVVAQ